MNKSVCAKPCLFFNTFPRLSTLSMLSTVVISHFVHFTCYTARILCCIGIGCNTEKDRTVAFLFNNRSQNLYNARKLKSYLQGLKLKRSVISMA